MLSETLDLYCMENVLVYEETLLEKYVIKYNSYRLAENNLNYPIQTKTCIIIILKGLAFLPKSKLQAQFQEVETGLGVSVRASNWKSP